jgi:uncharacterized cupredoxin-like copper-binding protein
VSPVRRPHALLVAGTVAAIVLTAGSTIGLAAASGAFRGRAPTGTGTRCAVPALPGIVVDVTLADMGAMMGGQSGSSSMMGGRRQGTPLARMFASPGVVPAGTVSLRVVNRGAQTHELVVLPLRAGQAIGTRTVGTDGRVDEAGSLGEASRSCGTGAGDGIAPGEAGWLTLALGPGRYELMCNLPGHYAAGMYTELDVR